jgi:hypothetical protein
MGTEADMRAAVLADAGVEALAQLFPRWRIWADADSGWHASRRGVFVQDYRDGAPVFSVHAPSAGELAGQLIWQEAAEAPRRLAAPAARRPVRAVAGLSCPAGRAGFPP